MPRETDDVSLRFCGGEVILRGLYEELATKQVLILVGESGSGKSAIAKKVTRDRFGIENTSFFEVSPEYAWDIEGCVSKVKLWLKEIKEIRKTKEIKNFLLVFDGVNKEYQWTDIHNKIICGEQIQSVDELKVIITSVLKNDHFTKPISSCFKCIEVKRLGEEEIKRHFELEGILVCDTESEPEIFLSATPPGSNCDYYSGYSSPENNEQLFDRLMAKKRDAYIFTVDDRLFYFNSSPPFPPEEVGGDYVGKKNVKQTRRKLEISCEEGEQKQGELSDEQLQYIAAITGHVRLRPKMRIAVARQRNSLFVHTRQNKSKEVTGVLSTEPSLVLTDKKSDSKLDCSLENRQKIILQAGYITIKGDDFRRIFCGPQQLILSDTDGGRSELRPPSCLVYDLMVLTIPRLKEGKGSSECVSKIISWEIGQTTEVKRYKGLVNIFTEEHSAKNPLSLGILLLCALVNNRNIPRSLLLNFHKFLEKNYNVSSYNHIELDDIIRAINELYPLITTSRTTEQDTIYTIHELSQRIIRIYIRRNELFKSSLCLLIDFFSEYSSHPKLWCKSEIDIINSVLPFLKTINVAIPDQKPVGVVAEVESQEEGCKTLVLTADHVSGTAVNMGIAAASVNDEISIADCGNKKKLLCVMYLQVGKYCVNYAQFPNALDCFAMGEKIADDPKIKAVMLGYRTLTLTYTKNYSEALEYSDICKRLGIVNNGREDNREAECLFLLAKCSRQHYIGKKYGAICEELASFENKHGLDALDSGLKDRFHYIYAKTLFELKKYEEAKKKFLLVTIFNNFSAEEWPSTANIIALNEKWERPRPLELYTYHRLGRLYFRMGKFEEARLIYEYVRERRNLLYEGKGNLHFANVLFDMATLELTKMCLDVDTGKRAQNYYDDVLKDYKDVLCIEEANNQRNESLATECMLAFTHYAIAQVYLLKNDLDWNCLDEARESLDKAKKIVDKYKGSFVNAHGKQICTEFVKQLFVKQLFFEQLENVVLIENYTAELILYKDLHALGEVLHEGSNSMDVTYIPNSVGNLVAKSRKTLTLQPPTTAALATAAPITTTSKTTAVETAINN